MKVKLGDIMAANEVLGKVFSAPVKKASTTYRIVRLKKEVVSVMQDFEEVRVACLNKYSVPVDEEGNVVEHSDRRAFIKTNENGEPVLDKEGKTIVDRDKIAAFDKEMTELYNTKEEINCYLKGHDHEQINDVLETPLTADEVFTISWCLEELMDMYEEEVK